MKRLLTNFLAISAVGLLMLSSCKKNDAVVKATSGKAGTLTATATAIALLKTDTTANPVVTFNFTSASYGYAAAITNMIQIDTAGDNWAKPAVSLTLGTNVTTQSYTTAQLNTMALNQLKIAAGKTGQYNVRVVQTIGTTVTPVYSNVITLSITPYSIVVPVTYLYVVGAYEGWNLAARDSLASKDGNIYTGVINFTAGNNQFLILPDANDYNNKYATNDSSTPTATVAVGANNNLVAPATAGNYLITLNLSAKTITFGLVNTYSVIGDAAQGWGTDVPMTFNNGTQSWTVTTAFVSTGSFKVRQNDDWTFSWGTISTPDGTSLTDASGGNIAVAASGNYLFSFKITPSTVGNNPPTTATYTMVMK